MFSIFIGAQKEVLRDKASMFFVAVFPVLLVFILGTMLASLDNPDSVIKPMTVAYYVDSDNPEVKWTAEAIIGEFDDIDQVNFVASSNPALAKAQLETGELTALVIFKEPLSLEIHEGLSGIQNKAVYSIFTSIARIYGCLASVMSFELLDGLPSLSDGSAIDLLLLEQTIQQGTKPGTTPGTTPGIVSGTTGLSVPDISAAFDGSRVQEKNYGVTRTMIDYYAITMIVMMFFMGSFFSGAMTLYQSRKDGTLKRILVSPQSRSSIYLQYAVSMVPINLFQIAIIMAVSSLLFGAHYAATWQLNLLLFAMLFAVSLACSCTSMILGMFIKFNPIILLMPVMWPMLFLCGTFSKEIFIPGVSDYLPPTIIQQAAFDITLFGSTSRGISVLLVSVALVLISTVIGAALFSKKDVAS